LNVEYIDAGGQLRQYALNISKTLAPGEWSAVPTKISDIPDSNQLARRVRVTVVSARIVEN